MRISFHPEATAELESAVDWYAERSPTAARDFCVAVDVALDNIEAHPERFAFIDTKHRASSVRKFPYQIVYQHKDDRIHVLAVAHAKRRPGYWRNRQ